MRARHSEGRVWDAADAKGFTDNAPLTYGQPSLRVQKFRGMRHIREAVLAVLIDAFGASPSKHTNAAALRETQPRQEQFHG